MGEEDSNVTQTYGANENLIVHPLSDLITYILYTRHPCPFRLIVGEVPPITPKPCRRHPSALLHHGALLGQRLLLNGGTIEVKSGGRQNQGNARDPLWYHMSPGRT